MKILIGANLDKIVFICNLFSPPKGIELKCYRSLKCPPKLTDLSAIEEYGD
jgi:hypothetical protein